MLAPSAQLCIIHKVIGQKGALQKLKAFWVFTLRHEDSTTQIVGIGFAEALAEPQTETRGDRQRFEILRCESKTRRFNLVFTSLLLDPH